MRTPPSRDCELSGFDAATCSEPSQRPRASGSGTSRKEETVTFLAHFGAEFYKGCDGNTNGQRRNTNDILRVQMYSKISVKEGGANLIYSTVTTKKYRGLPRGIPEAYHAKRGFAGGADVPTSNRSISSKKNCLARPFIIGMKLAANRSL